MIVDTSAIITIMLRESDRTYFLNKITDAGTSHMSAVSYMESSMVLISRRGVGAEEALDRTLKVLGITVAPVSVEQAKLAVAAFRQYGKGRHPAGLNFGDCFSYALAKSSGEPLLFKGSDFAKTDLQFA